ncbi:MAG: FG-GAP repeat protein, partial [Acidobacteria bacterium]|nr:FG-GAP repeat protein [Acidobacteriota bacterium]
MRKSSVLRVQPAAHHQNGGLHLPGEGQLLPAVDAVVREVALRYPAAPEDDGGFGDLFGTRVAIHGNKILVSSLKNDGGATDAGAAYVFEKDSISGWIQTARLGNPDPTSFDLFASDVDMYNDTILIGVRHDDDKGSSSGSAYLY